MAVSDKLLKNLLTFSETVLKEIGAFMTDISSGQVHVYLVESCWLRAYIASNSRRLM